MFKSQIQKSPWVSILPKDESKRFKKKNQAHLLYGLENMILASDAQGNQIEFVLSTRSMTLIIFTVQHGVENG